MKETRFIAQNKEKWREAETLLKSPSKDPEKLSNLFIQIVDDLSFSRTYYPNRSVRVYLNKIARQYFSILYNHRKGKRNQFKLFWLDELPQIIIFCRRQLLASLLIFLLAFIIGVFSSYSDPQFVSTILGERYVTMTKENIESGDPMAVYKQMNEIDMFLQITFNNLMVAFRTYLLGIFLGIGTIGSLLFNGIMVGCFQYFFIERDLAMQSSLTIWLHGTLEISSIILAGGAGLTLGSGLIFPGTYSRIQSLQLAGIRSLKLMLGITPVFILAAIIESFLSRYTEAPAFIKLFLILASAVFIVGYFVVYPWTKAKKGFEVPLKEVKLPPNKIEPVNYGTIKTNAEILKDSFQFYSRYSARILSWVFVVALCVATASQFIREENFLITEEDWLIKLLYNTLLALDTPTPAFILINTLGLSVVLYRILKLIEAESRKKSFSLDLKCYLSITVIAAIMFTLIYFGVLTILLLVFGSGFLLFTAFAQFTQSGNLFKGASKAMQLFGKNNNQGLALQFIVWLLSFSFLLVLSAPLLYMHLNVLEWNFLQDDAWSKQVIQFLESFIKILSFYLVLPIAASSFSFLYFSQEEVGNANSLKESIIKMGARISKHNKW